MSQPLIRLNDYARSGKAALDVLRQPYGIPVVVKAQTVPRMEGKQNQTEAKYARKLEQDRLAGRIVRYDFEPVKLRLADMTHLTPDFRVILADGTEEYHEVKGGYVREDGWIKLKLAAELHPYVFKMAQFRKGVWTIRTV